MPGDVRNYAPVAIAPGGFSDQRMMGFAFTMENTVSAGGRTYDSGVTYDYYIVAIDTTAPTVTFSPANDATDVSSSSDITLTFDEAIRKTDDTELTDLNVDTLITLKSTDASGDNIDFDATISGNVITINPTSDFSSAQVVYVAIGATYTT